MSSGFELLRKSIEVRELTRAVLSTDRLLIEDGLTDELFYAPAATLANTGVEFVAVQSPLAPANYTINYGASGLPSDKTKNWLYSHHFVGGKALANLTDAFVTLHKLQMSDSVDASVPGAMDMLRIVHRLGSTKGGRQTLKIDMLMLTAPADTIHHAYTPLELVSAVNVTHGGTGSFTTDPATGYIGGWFGGNSNGRLDAGATFWFRITAWEFNVTVATGASVFQRVGLGVIKGASDRTRAVADDAAIFLADQDNGNAAPWKDGFLFGLTTGVFPFNSTSALFRYQRRLYPTGSAVLANTESVGYGFDFRELNFANAVFATQYWTVGPTGYHDFKEQTAPAAPAADYARLYAVDNGAGKTQLMVRFSSGAAQQVAIQP